MRDNMFYKFIFDAFDIDAITGFRTDREIEISVENPKTPWGDTGQRVITQNIWTLDFSSLDKGDKANIANALLKSLGIDSRVEIETVKKPVLKDV